MFLLYYRIQELETALKEEYANDNLRRSDEEVDNITEIARPNIWQSCLGVRDVDSKMDTFDDIFDLPEQKILREDCLHFVCMYRNSRIYERSFLISLVNFWCFQLN